MISHLRVLLEGIVANPEARLSALPLLTSSDFEWGVQMRIAGATKLPRAMAFGAARDPQLAYAAGKIVGTESRALGVHVDFGPVAAQNSVSDARGARAGASTWVIVDRLDPVVLAETVATLLRQRVAVTS